MKDYVRISLETHLFFARIMKEHALFLQAGFVQKNVEWIRKADFFRKQFEDLLRRTVEMSSRMISGSVLQSEELVTKFTLDAEKMTSDLSGISIDSRITLLEKELECGRDFQVSREMMQRISRLNERAVWLLNGLIDFKENLLEEVKESRIFTTNYPLLIDHITREAKLYRETIEGLMKNQRVCYRNLQKQENFWNCIMKEHALFIRGLLDPCEEELICATDGFAGEFEELLEMACKQDCRAQEAAQELSDKSLEKTVELRDFKAAGTKGVLEGQIQAIFLPLLADHVLREANHYIRILDHGYMWQEG